ncbi:MAG TPA: hypothetical protein VFC38_12845, partial [Stellaceae bacterium]|nr:hypothetical protein [Stellaceae bacterium]
LHAWRDFHFLIATSAATLIGAMFVVASIGGRFLTPTRSAASRMFLTPTILHLGSVLFACALTLVPTLDDRALAGLLGLGGVAGLGYSAAIAFNIHGRRRVEFQDRIWYAAVPVLGYAGFIAAAALIFLDASWSLECLAAALALLLLSGMRNAWDMVVYFVTQTPG